MMPQDGPTSLPGAGRIEADDATRPGSALRVHTGRPWLSRWRLATWTVVLTLLLGTFWTVRSQLASISRPQPDVPIPKGQVAGGTLVIAGGGSLPPSVYQHFCQLAGGPRARLVVFPAGSLSESLKAEYVEFWAEKHVASVDVLESTSRRESDRPEFSRLLLEATGVWLGGGQQSFLTSHYRGTLVERRIRELLERGGVVGGTSAGAAAISDAMIAGGRGDAPTLDRGFGLIDHTLIDQHFMRRNRLPRLMAALEQRPDLLGLGIDEGAAVVLERRAGNLQVIGSSYVMTIAPLKRTQGQLRLQTLRPGDTCTLAQLRAGDLLEPAPLPIELLLGE